MSDTTLLLDSLYVENFRAFPQLTVEKFGRVNLIVGRNSVGKSCLLSAVYLYANYLTSYDTYQIYSELHFLILEDELVHTWFQRGRHEFEGLSESLNEGLSRFFYGRPQFTSPKDEASPTFILDRTPTATEQRLIFQYVPKGYKTRGISLTINGHNHANEELALTGLDSNYVPIKGLSNKQLRELWDKVILTPKEATVLKALQIIIPTIQAMNLTGQNIAMVRIAEEKRAVPLGSLGEGVQRLLGIILALVNAENGVFFIDEVEIGLHYTTQYQLWQMIFAVATELNIQVFATTHSWDCIAAFQRAATENQSAEGVLINLRHNKKGKLITTIFSEEELETVTAERIEVR